jgi:hypothetical protein
MCFFLEPVICLEAPEPVQGAASRGWRTSWTDVRKKFKIIIPNEAH